MLARFFSWYDRFLVGLGYIPGILAGLMTIGIGTDILVRNIGFSPIVWMLDAEEYALLAIAMTGTATVLRMGRHIRVDIGLMLMPPRARILVQYIGTALCFFISAVIVYYGMRATLTAYADNSTFFKSYPIKEWIPLLSVPFAFTLTAIECLRSLFTMHAAAREALTHAPQDVL